MGDRSGELYVGHRLHEATSEPTGERLEIPSHRFTTHGVIVGMTGSGKTGLGIVLLEEVLSSGIPALILDPKGDMGNLLLNFPDLRPADFEPWVDEGEAKREGISTPKLAEETAALWKSGLAESGITPDQMAGFRDGVDIRILTPGSTAGIPLNVIGNLAPPPISWDEEGETIRDEIEGLVSGILVLADIDPDPLTSREHILISNLVEHSWRAGKTLDMASLIMQIQDPPLRRLGVFELDTFFPEKDRTKLAMKLNGLMASPSFVEWIQGEPLDIAGLLWAPDGRPRASIIYLSHLSDRERQFVVTLLLSKVVTWMRQQAGTSELRALVYGDEVMGFAPPTAEPPSKRPILTLYKQARAHGVGVVLATQNPVDMDYKLMSNAGTWMIGRLQTERDKARIIEALRSASGAVDTKAWDARISALGKRQFVLKTTRSADPELFSSRWAMSFLRGPMTRAELQRVKPKEAGVAAETGAHPGIGAPLVAEPATPPGVPPAETPATAVHPSPEAAPHTQVGPRGAATRYAGGVTSLETSPRDTLAPDESPIPPNIAEGIAVRYLDPGAPWIGELGVAPGARRLAPGLAARVHLLFDDQYADLRHEEEWEAVFFPLSDRLDPGTARAVDYDTRDLRTDAPRGSVYVLSDLPLDKSDFYRSAEKAIKDHLHRNRTVTVLRNSELKLYSRVGETREAFLERCLAAAEDRADEASEKLRDRYESKLKTAESRRASAERRVRELEVDVDQRRQQEVISGVGDVLSMFLGGRRRTRSLSGISSRRSMTRRTKERLRSAEEKLEEYDQAILGLGEELQDELKEIWEEWEEKAGEVEEYEVGLERTDLQLTEMVLFWAPTG